MPITGSEISQNDECFNCNNEYEEINYPELNEEDAKKKVMEKYVILKKYGAGIYCDCYGDRSNGVEFIRHYIWNKCKRKMIGLKGQWMHMSGVHRYIYFSNGQSVHTHNYNNEIF